MIIRTDVRGGVHTSHTSVTSVTSVTRPVYAGCRGTKKNRSVTKMLQQVLHKPLPRQTNRWNNHMKQVMLFGQNWVFLLRAATLYT